MHSNPTSGINGGRRAGVFHYASGGPLRGWRGIAFTIHLHACACLEVMPPPRSMKLSPRLQHPPLTGFVIPPSCFRAAGALLRLVGAANPRHHGVVFKEAGGRLAACLLRNVLSLHTEEEGEAIAVAHPRSGMSSVFACLYRKPHSRRRSWCTCVPLSVFFLRIIPCSRAGLLCSVDIAPVATRVASAGP